MAKKNYVEGFGEQAPDIKEFLRPSNTDPFQASASDVGYNSRWAAGDDDGTRDYAGYGVDGADDCAAFVRPSWTGDRDYAHQEIYGIVDNQSDQPAGKILGGGGPVSDNKHGGVGDGDPRFAPKKHGPSTQINRESAGGVDRNLGRRAR
jgi:hypothetical protein